MNETMVERIARTLCDERRRIWNESFPDKADDFTWETENEGYREQLRQEARAVLMALPEPTKEMLRAGSAVWRSMVDMALDTESE